MRDEVAAAYRAAGRPAEVVAFLDDMERRFGDADLVLARSGATTCAELAVAGKAAVLVPFARRGRRPPATNARAMEAAGAARVLEEKDLTGDSLAAALRALVEQPEALAAMDEAARRLGATGRGRARRGPPGSRRSACLDASSTCTSSASAAPA